MGSLKKKVFFKNMSFWKSPPKPSFHFWTYKFQGSRFARYLRNIDIFDFREFVKKCKNNTKILISISVSVSVRQFQRCVFFLIYI